MDFSIVLICVSGECGLQCGNHGKADKACSKCVCEKPWIGEKCGMYAELLSFWSDVTC